MTKDQINSLRKRIGRTMESIRNIPRPLNPGSPTEAKKSERWEGNLDGESADRLVIYLRSSGCSWAIDLQKPGHLLPGCLDCEHSVAETTYGRPISAADYLKQFRGKFHDFGVKRCPILCLYNEGSFFNEKELPAEARRQILRDIADDGHVKRLVLETLPSYVSDAVLQETTDLLGSVELEVGIGLESSSEAVRALCINKPYSLKAFERAAETVRQYCRLLAYVMLKPSFLSEKEALDDAKSTVEYAFAKGVDAVSVEPVSVGKFTMSGVLYYLNLYRPAWLWSVLDCAKFAASRGEVRIGGYQFAPAYIYHASNCDLCTREVKGRIQLFNQTHKRDDLERISFLCCTKAWQRELAEECPPLELRISKQLDRVESLLSDPKAINDFLRGESAFNVL